MSLFQAPEESKPLAERLRPKRFEDLVGLESVTGGDTPLGRQIRDDTLGSSILWGPPGSGKTTIARLVQGHTKRPFTALSAVLSGLKEVREVMGGARARWQNDGTSTILFIDEIHRFNKAQQDAFLPFLEEGSVSLIGTTTENPSFQLTPALLSRCRVTVLPPLEPAGVLVILRRAVAEDSILAQSERTPPEEILETLSGMAAGDARFALNALEAVVLQYPEEDEMTPVRVRSWLQSGRIVYDWGGEEHYNLISALHKSVRNSDPDAALYWLFRMLEGGEDPLYIVRRMVRMASEDIGNADPQALRRALDAKEAVEFIGLPEGALALAQALVYMAAAPKSNRIYVAADRVKRDLLRGHRYPVPLALRNAPTKLMEEAKYGEGYVYAPDTEEGIADLSCLPPQLSRKRYYEPKDTGFEKRISEWLDRWKELRRKAAVRDKKRDGE